MEKIKVIKGTPIYVYRSKSSLDPIQGLLVKGMKYDSDKNITYVKLKRPTIWTELLCTLLIAMCVTFSIINYNGLSIKCNYNSLVNYYDNKLFLNWQNPEENSTDITFELSYNNNSIYRETLSPGESLTYIEVDDVEDKYICNMSSKVFFKEVSDRVTLNIVNRELKQGE